jgi:murein DD-endopeptidase MepM/ murein hydrolase activator NlpD
MMLNRRRALTMLAWAGGAMLLPFSAARAETRFDGDFEQGGMVVGRTVPGAKVSLDGRAIRVSDDGIFVFGFGRDQGPSARLTVRSRGEEPVTETLTIKQREYKIQSIKGLPDAQVTPPDDAVARINRDNKLIGAARSFDTHETWFADGIDWPVNGPITGVYGSQRVLNGEPRRPHFGVDIAKGEGEPIRAPQKAIVRMAEKDMYFTGGTTILDHGGGISSSYLHQSRLDVAVGDTVEKGQVIGLIGKTGRATGPHLCWRLNWFAERLDPQLAAPPLPG